MKEISLSSWNPPPGYRKMAGKELPFPLMERGQISSVAHLSAIIENYLNKSLNFDSDFDVIC